MMSMDYKELRTGCVDVRFVSQTALIRTDKSMLNCITANMQTSNHGRALNMDDAKCKFNE